MYAFLLEQDLRWQWESRWLESHVLISTKAFVDPFKGKAEAIAAMRRRRRWCGGRCWFLCRLVVERNLRRCCRFHHVLLVLGGSFRLGWFRRAAHETLEHAPFALSWLLVRKIGRVRGRRRDLLDHRFWNWSGSRWLPLVRILYNAVECEEGAVTGGDRIIITYN